VEPDFSYEDYQRMHRLEADLKDARATIEEQRQTLGTLNRAILDLEAEHFADKLEREIDLQTWDGIHAAHVGHDLEEIADKLMAAILAYSRGEDVYGALYDVHGDVCSLMADITTTGKGD